MTPPQSRLSVGKLCPIASMSAQSLKPTGAHREVDLRAALRTDRSLRVLFELCWRWQAPVDRDLLVRHVLI